MQPKILKLLEKNWKQHISLYIQTELNDMEKRGKKGEEKSIKQH